MRLSTKHPYNSMRWMIPLLSLTFEVTASEGLDSKKLWPYLDNHCMECHDELSEKGGVNLDELSFNLEDSNSFDLWVKIYDQIEQGAMPPSKKPRPP